MACCRKLEEPPLELAERDARVAAEHQAQPRRAGRDAPAVEHRLDVPGRRAEADAGLVAGAGEGVERKVHASCAIFAVTWAAAAIVRPRRS
jgi:hypothetical protein